MTSFPSLCRTGRSGGRLLLLTTVVPMLLTGCGKTRNAVPFELVSQAQVVGLPGVRDWGDTPSELFQKDFVESVRQVRRRSPQGLVDKAGTINVLALSGGGSDGAFGAGLLCGWTQAGNRPAFKLVTGISTGAMIAPFAFLGSEYDPLLKKFYTTTSADDVMKVKGLRALLFGHDSLADSAPLAKIIASVVDEKVLAAVAAEHMKGRRLFIGTTNFDALRLTVWNMGAIAASGKPGALELFRNIMRASASIPGALPPVYVPVTAGGKTYDEMHVDGGVSAQVFFYGFMLDIAAIVRDSGIAEVPPIKLYIIRNTKLRPGWKAVRPRIAPIAGRSISSLIAYQGVGDLYRIYMHTQRDGIGYNLASIPRDWKPISEEMFDKKEMNALFDLGYGLASKGYKWQKLPPGFKK